MAASNILTSNQMIRSIIRRAMIPNDQNTFTDEDFLEMINEEMGYFAVPHLLRHYEEYLVNHIDIPTELNTTTGEFKTEYEIPARAVGNKLRDVAYIDNSGNFFELSRVSLEDLSDYNLDYVNDYTQLFYVENNKIVLVNGVPNVDGTIRMYFYLKPNKMVLENRVATIASIDTNTGLVTLNNFPDNFTGATELDLIQAISPNNVLAFDKTATNVDPNTSSVTFNPSDLPSDLQIGDYVALAGETIVPQLPTELHPVLAQRVAIQCLEALGDQQGYQVAQRRLEQMENALGTILDNRVEGAPEKINNRHGALRESLWGSYGYNKRNRGGY